jgi:hypothetical protein
VLYYLVTDIKSGLISKVMPRNLGHLYLSGLSAESAYTFTIAAVSVDGASLPSSITPVVTTGAAPIVVVASTAAALAAPDFTLSSVSETRTVNTSATGFTISSTGGAIASFVISATPAGMSFETSTGTLSGTPNTVAVATTYTITATNATGSATQTFTLTVVAIVYTVGDTGPGGGIVFYVSATVFTSTDSSCGTVCRYLEAAPNTWSGGVVDPYQLWADALVATLAYTSGSTNDWYLPFKDELNELYLARTTVGGFKLDYYWSSSANGSAFAWGQLFDNSGRQNSLDKPEPAYVRPVRAF